MTELDETTCEQLSAWMDGALPPEEARFLERRLQHDAALRAKWERLQLASNCLRGHDVLPMPRLADRVAQSLAAAPAAQARRPLLGWAIAASAAVLAIALVPRLLPGPGPDAVATQPVPAAPAPQVEPRTPGPTPGSADLVASAPEARGSRAAAPAPRSPVDVAPAVAAQATSPTEFPLSDATRPASWPRAGLPGSDAAMEGYLVRHNEMAGADALGGFVPYLDVVAAGAEESRPAAANPDPRADGGDGK